MVAGPRRHRAPSSWHLCAMMMKRPMFRQQECKLRPCQICERTPMPNHSFPPVFHVEIDVFSKHAVGPCAKHAVTACGGKKKHKPKHKCLPQEGASTLLPALQPLCSKGQNEGYSITSHYSSENVSRPPNSPGTKSGSVTLG